MLYKQISFAITGIFLTILIGGAIDTIVPNEAQATGGAGEIKGLIDPIVERAITALQNNNTDLALEEITSLKQELDDTFSTDDKEEKDDDD